MQVGTRKIIEQAQSASNTTQQTASAAEENATGQELFAMAVNLNQLTQNLQHLVAAFHL